MLFGETPTHYLIATLPNLSEIPTKDGYRLMKKQKISDAVIHRLPRYYRYLDDLHNKGVVRISSNSLGSRMDITASQIRQDLNNFGGFGQQGYGYSVAKSNKPCDCANFEIAH